VGEYLALTDTIGAGDAMAEPGRRLPDGRASLPDVWEAWAAWEALCRRRKPLPMLLQNL
jgi:hypothetical protein